MSMILTFSPVSILDYQILLFIFKGNMTTLEDPQIVKLEKILNLVGLSGAIFFLIIPMLLVSILLITKIGFII